MRNFSTVVTYFNPKVLDHAKITITFSRILIFKNNPIEYAVKLLRSHMMKSLLAYYPCFIHIAI